MITLPQRRRPGPKPRLRPVRPTQHNNGPGPRPFTWCTGPDPVRHDRYVAWSRARAQAQFRGETWHLTFAEFEDIWGEQWPQRGRGSLDLCMTRSDIEGAWEKGNVELITRTEHNRRCAVYRMLTR
jgi:hypothetical protein